MMQRIRDRAPRAAMLAEGLRTIAQSAAAAYGNGGRLLGADAAGNAVYTDKLGDFLTRARLQCPATDAVRALLAADTLDDGMKTAVILADALCARLDAQGLSADGLMRAKALCRAHLEKLARNNGGVLPGGGLYVLNLARPLSHLADTESLPAAQALAEAAGAPLLALAGAAGFAGHEVYERMRAASPNQFYSLRHFGLTGSIDGKSEFYDVIGLGLDSRTGKLTDLTAAGVTVPVETGCAALFKAIDIVQTLYAVKSVLV